jgi:RHS repeat-associated protein
MWKTTKKKHTFPRSEIFFSFDNIAVSQDHGRISEENHYYAFGQKITGICTAAFNKLPKKFNYQGDYSEDEDNTGWDEFDLRMYDPQIGRRTGADPYDEFPSPYVGMGNNPVNNVDEDGGGVEGPLLAAGISDASINNFGQALLNAGYCIPCEFESNAMTLADVYVIAKKVPQLTFTDKFNIYSEVFKYVLWDSWKGIGRDALIRGNGPRISCISQ